MDRYRDGQQTQKSRPAAHPPGFENVYTDASFFGSGDRANYHSRSTSSSQDEPLYPSSPYQHNQLTAEQQVPQRAFRNGKTSSPFTPAQAGPWQPLRQTSTQPQHPPPPPPPPSSQPQQQDQPYSLGPFHSIWSVNSNEMASANISQHQHQTQKQGQPKVDHWPASTSANYQPPPPQVNSSQGSGSSHYHQGLFGHMNGDVGGGHQQTSAQQQPADSYPWSPYDGVNDATITPELTNWNWLHPEFTSAQYSHMPATGSHNGFDEGVGNRPLNEWELPDSEFQRKVLDADRKGRQERREWKKMGFIVPDTSGGTGGHQGQRKLDESSKVVADFLEKLRDNSLSFYSEDIDAEGHDHSLPAYDQEQVESDQRDVSNINSPLVDNSRSAETFSKQNNAPVEHTDHHGNRPDLMRVLSAEAAPNHRECDETSSNVDASGVEELDTNGKIRSLSDPVISQGAVRNKNIKKSGVSSIKPLDNGKMRPGKRKPKSSRRKNNSTETCDAKSCSKENTPNKIKEENVLRTAYTPDESPEGSNKSAKPVVETPSVDGSVSVGLDNVGDNARCKKETRNEKLRRTDGHHGSSNSTWGHVDSEPNGQCVKEVKATLGNAKKEYIKKGKSVSGIADATGSPVTNSKHIPCSYSEEVISQLSHNEKKSLPKDNPSVQKVGKGSEQLTKPVKDNELFFDPKRIFGGQKTTKTTSDTPKKSSERPASSCDPLVNTKKSNSKKEEMMHNLSENLGMTEDEKKSAKQCSVPASSGLKESDQLLTSAPNNHHEEVGSSHGPIPTKDLPQQPDSHVPFASAKEAFASKVSALKAEAVSSSDSSEMSTGRPVVSPSEPRVPQTYSYKKDIATGVLRRSSDPKPDLGRRDSSGSQPGSADLKGERRCSGESHMDGFHHPFGCSSGCYTKSPSPTLKSSANEKSASSEEKHTLPRKKDFARDKSPRASPAFPQKDAKANSHGFEAAFAKQLRDGLKNTWLSKEKAKQSGQGGEGAEEQEQPKSQEKMPKQSASATSHATNPPPPPKTTDTKQHKEQKVPTAGRDSRDKEKRQNSNQEQPGQQRPPTGTPTMRPRPPAPHPNRSQQGVPQQNTDSGESDLEEEMNRQITNEWWFKLGKNLIKGGYWLLLFILLLCLVILSYLWALLKIVLKFGFQRARDLWAWYWQQPSHSRSNSGWSQGGSSWGQGTPAGRGNHQRKKQTHNIELPDSEQAAIRRLLACDRDNFYEVVGVAEDASEEEVKKFYRRQCMMVHPDKTSQPGANEAFQILQKAYATLSDQTKRAEYDYEINNNQEMFAEKLDEFLKKMEELANTMPCGICMGSHRRYPTDLPLYAARYCSRHNARHPVSDGALWKETANLGFKVYVFLCDGNRVYDVTEWAGCQSLDWLEPNSCQILCKVKRAKGGSSNQQRRHQQFDPGYEEMFDDIFGPGTFSQFQSAADQQQHHSHHGNSNGAAGGGGGGEGGGGGGGGGHHRPGAGRNPYNRTSKKSRKKKR